MVPAQNVLIYNYPVEGSEESIRRVLGAYGVIERISFRHWTHLTNVSDGVRVVRMIRRQAIPRPFSWRLLSCGCQIEGPVFACSVGETLCDGPIQLVWFHGILVPFCI